ncbi:hypothetical protein [Gimesia sp.]|uniref:hypothetical protein n=1 Tax=Gimesia sp. TaxID=2024833 RepID=UPI003A958277
MRKRNVLTKEIATQFLEDPGSVELYGFTEIEGEAAEFLSKHEGELDLQALITVSDNAAQSLSQHKGQLILAEIRYLSLAAANSLAKHENIIFISQTRPVIEGFQSLPLTHFPDTSDFPILVNLFGWLKGKDNTWIAPNEMNLTSENAAKLVSHFSSDQTMHLNYWFGKIGYDALEQLVPYSGSLEIAADQLKEGAYSLVSQLNARELTVDVVETCEPDELRKGFADALISFRNKLNVVLLCLSDEVRSILQHHHSYAEWGECSEPFVRVNCGTCGVSETYYLEIDESRVDFENSLSCIARNAWTESSDHGFICPDCSQYSVFLDTTPINVHMESKEDY